MEKNEISLYYANLYNLRKLTVGARYMNFLNLLFPVQFIIIGLQFLGYIDWSWSVMLIPTWLIFVAVFINAYFLFKICKYCAKNNKIIEVKDFEQKNL